MAEAVWFFCPLGFRAGRVDLGTWPGRAALHSGTFAGAPASGKRVEWDEIGVLHFDDEGRITDLWFMCQELSLAEQIGYTMQLS
ncbi:ester cyclase [Streptomyces sp. NEAU-NA10]|uniref:ester cyclase n=1 Tax=Streptomyces sp. NEAU-NA10 TaxID=3416050 RepID=UPI003CC50544